MIRLSEQHYQEFKKTNRDSIEVLCNGPVVYIRNLKCASTFFYGNFLSVQKWWNIKWDDINWGNQHVFSHIMHPVERRHKGVAEYITLHKLDDTFKQSYDMQRLIKHVPMLDEHSASYHDTFGRHCYHIDWIPISGYSNAEVIALTEKLLKVYGIRKFNWDYTQVHSSSPEQKSIENTLVSMYNENEVPVAVKRYLEYDLQLWFTVKSRFDAQGETWEQCSWLRPIG
jgi:hypothetical protein